MKIKDSVCSVCLALTTGVISLVAQDIHLPAPSDPFVIQKGSSFSASAPARVNSNNTNTSSINSDSIISDIYEAIEIIKNNHSNTVSDDVITKHSISSMLASLDPHSNYYDTREYQDLTGRYAGEYVGVGVSIGNFKNNHLETYIIGTADGSASRTAGLIYGDRIVAVDGVKTGGHSAAMIRELIRGKEGTKVNIEIQRPGYSNNLTFELSRSKIEHKTIPYSFKLSDDIGYINMTEGFSSTTFDEFESALNSLRSKNIRSLIIDLRGNRGGILEQAVKIAEKLLPNGRKILSQRGRIPSQDRVWYSQNNAPEEMPLVVLVDNASASASEIIAGALQDNDRALIVGETTFGKGLVQNVIPLDDGSGMTLTAARYYTPSGRSIQREYTKGELYSYFNRTAKASAIERSKYAAKTLSDRVVYGGNGIEPDMERIAEPITESENHLIDPIFFFVRNKTTDADFQSSVRQNILFGRTNVDSLIFDEFVNFVEKNNDWKYLRGLVETKKDFVYGRLAYEIALAGFGSSTAFEINLRHDIQIAEAVKNMSKAAELNHKTANTFAGSDPFKK